MAYHTAVPAAAHTVPPHHDDKMVYQAPPQTAVVQSRTRQGWETGLFGCFNNVGACCLAWWCPCIIYGKTKNRLRNPNSDGYGGSCCNTGCLLYCVCLSYGCGACCMQMSQRKEIREKYHLTGNCCGDCLKAVFCTCCDLMQADNEVRAKSKSMGVVNEATYRKPEGMVYGP